MYLDNPNLKFLKERNQKFNSTAFVVLFDYCVQYRTCKVDNHIRGCSIIKTAIGRTKCLVVMNVH